MIIRKLYKEIPYELYKNLNEFLSHINFYYIHA